MKKLSTFIKTSTPCSIFVYIFGYIKIIIIAAITIFFIFTLMSIIDTYVLNIYDTQINNKVLRGGVEK